MSSTAFFFILNSNYIRTHSINTSFGVGRVTALIGGYDMRKITPVMLVLLLVASLMANIDITQLETTEVIEETGARSVQMLNSLQLLHRKKPNATHECRNEIFVGQATTFEVYIQNSGDQAIPNWLQSQLFGLPTAMETQCLQRMHQVQTLSSTTLTSSATMQAFAQIRSLASGSVYKGGKTNIIWGGDAHGPCCWCLCHPD